MTAFAGGQVMCGGEGRVHVHIWGEPYYICPEDLGMLLFVGERVSLFKKRPTPEDVPKVAGSVYLSPSGRAIIIDTGRNRYMLPRDKFLAVALGEDVSCIFFEVPTDNNPMEIISPCKGGEA
jgi:glyoxylase-like metal-dependent hydrolase (beta-lactamase superfamily II)